MHNLDSLIPIVCGVYAFMLAKGILPRNPKDPEKTRMWRERYGGMLSIVCPVVVIIATARLLGVFG